MKRKPNDHIEKNISKDARTITRPVKLNDEEDQDLCEKAGKFCKSNTSLYIRTALYNYKPKKEDFNE